MHFAFTALMFQVWHELLQGNLVYRRPERLDDISFLPGREMEIQRRAFIDCFRNIHERDALYIQCMLIVEITVLVF